MQSRRNLLLVAAFLYAATMCVGQSGQRLLDYSKNAMPVDISGSVQNSSGHGVANARVEARSIVNGAMVASTYTNDNGTFQLSVPSGQYEVVAQAGLTEARDRVTADGVGGIVNLRIDDHAAGSD